VHTRLGSFLPPQANSLACKGKNSRHQHSTLYFYLLF
jgi:hypothetical protein